MLCNLFVSSIYLKKKTFSETFLLCFIVLISFINVALCNFSNKKFVTHFWFLCLILSIDCSGE